METEEIPTINLIAVFIVIFLLGMLAAYIVIGETPVFCEEKSNSNVAQQDNYNTNKLTYILNDGRQKTNSN